MARPKSMSVKLEEDNIIDYVVVGNGSKDIVCIPGLSDGLATVKGKHLLLWYYYKRFRKDYKLYIFSRRRNIPEQWTIEDMAENLIKASVEIGIKKPHIIGVSMGGMIAQTIAILDQDFFDKMVLGITCSYANSTVKNNVSNWIELIMSGKFKEFNNDLYSKTYTDNYLKKERFFLPLLSSLIKVKDKKRFITQASACLNFNLKGKLNSISKSVLVIGGNSDKIVGSGSSEELSNQISTSRLRLFEGIGHSLCEERQREFDEEILSFLRE